MNTIQLYKIHYTFYCNIYILLNIPNLLKLFKIHRIINNYLLKYKTIIWYEITRKNKNKKIIYRRHTL